MSSPPSPPRLGRWWNWEWRRTAVSTWSHSAVLLLLLAVQQMASAEEAAVVVGVVEDSESKRAAGSCPHSHHSTHHSSHHHHHHHQNRSPSSSGGLKSSHHHHHSSSLSSDNSLGNDSLITKTSSISSPSSEGTSAFSSALLSTVLVIFASFLLVRLLKMLRVNRGSGSSEKKKGRETPSSGPGFRYVGRGINFDQQSVAYDNIETERISRLLAKTKQLATHQFDDVLTLNDVFRRGHKVSGDAGRCLGRSNRATNSVDYIPYGTVLKRQKTFADGLLQLGLKPHSSKMGIYSANSPEYVLAEYGAYRHSLVVVPIYDTLGTNVASFIANQAQLSVVAVDKLERVEKVVEQAAAFTSLRHLVLMNSALINEEIRAKVSKSGFQLHTMLEVEQLGEQHPQPDHKPTVNDLAIICYTSGTTSVPKGVMLSHENVIASVATISIHLMDEHATKDDVMISILPLAHMFQRIAEASVFCEGGVVSYYSGDIQQLAAEIQIIRPTIMLAVPRLLNRIYDAVQAKVRGSLLKKTLLRWAYAAKRAELRERVIRQDTIWDRFVFGAIRANLGGRVRLICVGSAPLSHAVLDFLRCALGCVISEGYGQTECVGPCTATQMGDCTTGHVGPPLVGCRVKLADFAEMGYYASEGKGEILVKGPVVFKGYYQLPEETSKAIDQDGWLHTGDIGVWTEEGTLRLIDRKKNIFKLSQGEYIAPEKIENALVSSRFVAQLFVYGESLKSQLVAIVVPDFAFLKSLPKFSAGGVAEVNEGDSSKKLNKNSALKAAILEDLQRLGRRSGLKSFELPKSVYIHGELFTIEGGLLTPTLKSKRNEISKRFSAEIAALYEELAVAAEAQAAEDAKKISS